jgi:NAD(P)-dependent dehydrogenase (short-subunit alcohol dehydrogenase family)
MTSPLAGKKALITGGGTGIGQGVARALAAEGCRLVLCGRREAPLRETAEALGGAPRVRWRACDVADRAAVEALFAWLRARDHEPELVAHCAGINVSPRTMAEVDPADFDRVLATNATGAFNVMRAALPAMRRRRDGLIVNVVSVAGRRMFPLAGAPYTAAKFAQAALGGFVNMETAAEGVRVTNLYPGEVNTPILDQRPEPPPPEQRARMLQPEDFGALVVCLARLPARALVSDLVITPTYMPQP